MGLPQEKLNEIILKNALIDEKGLHELTEYAHNADMTITDALIEKNIITDDRLGTLVAQELKVPFVNLYKIAIPEEVFSTIPERLARKKRIIAFERNETQVKVATIDPYNTEVLQMIARKSGLAVLPHYATERDILASLHIYKKDLQKTLDKMLADAIGRAGHATNDAPIAKIVDLLIDFAYQNKTSDVHIEIEEKNSLVRFRIDGILHDVLFLPKNLHDRIITRIKVLSRLRTDEHLSAQDGKMRISLDEENLDIRVSIVPIVEGEKAVLRLLTSKRQFSLVDLGMAEEDLKKVTKAFTRSFGMVLSTGPTGSGKSTSIYAILKILNTREKNITTIEDPVEYRIKGVNQIQVITKTGLTFAAGLRSILRQDPNIVFVGEIRDSETAGIAVNAALTGHLVLSTLHTNDAATTLPRLTDMKVEPFLVASTVNVIIAQRLLRKICDHCKTSITLPTKDLALNIPEEKMKKYFGNGKEIKEITVYKGKGCDFCHFTGYLGRIGIFEVLEVSNAIKKLITEKRDSNEIAQQAIKEGMTTMLDDGLNKIVRGMTSVEEVLRVTKVESV